MESEESVLQKTALMNRQNRQQKTIDQALSDEEQQDGAAITGYEASNGLMQLNSPNGSSFYASAITNGAIGKGDQVRLRQGTLPSWDAMPHRSATTFSPQKQSIKYSVPILFSVSEQFDLYRLDLNYKTYRGYAYHDSSTPFIGAYCETVIKTLYYEVPTGVVPDFYLSSPDWRTYDYYAFPSITSDWQQSGGQSSQSPGSTNNWFNYQYYNLRFVPPTNFQYAYTTDSQGYTYINPTIGDNSTSFFASCIFDPNLIILETPGLNYAIYTLDSHRNATSWDDSSKNRCTWNLTSQSLAKVDPSNYPNSYTPTSAQKYYLGGDRQTPLSLKVLMLGTHQAYISAAKSKRYITFKYNLSARDWQNILVLTVDGSSIYQTQSDPFPSDDWRKSLTQAYQYNPPSSGNMCIDQFRAATNTNLDTSKNLLYSWNFDNDIKTKALSEKVDKKSISNSSNLCTTSTDNPLIVNIYSLNNINSTIVGAAPTTN